MGFGLWHAKAPLQFVSISGSVTIYQTRKVSCICVHVRMNGVFWSILRPDFIIFHSQLHKFTSINQKYSSCACLVQPISDKKKIKKSSSLWQSVGTMKTNFHLGWQKETAVLSQWAIYLILREGEKKHMKSLNCGGRRTLNLSWYIKWLDC